MGQAHRAFSKWMWRLTGRKATSLAKFFMLCFFNLKISDFQVKMEYIWGAQCDDLMDVYAV